MNVRNIVNANQYAWVLRNWILDKFETHPLLFVSCVLFGPLTAIVLAAVLIDHFFETNAPITELSWLFFGRALGADAISDKEHLTNAHKLIMLIVTLLSVILIGFAAGLITTFLSACVDQLRMGRQDIAQERHTVLIGWSPTTPNIVKELIDANKSEGGKPIIILANKEKANMDAELRRHIPLNERHGSKVFTRTGSGSRMIDLEMVAAADARAILLLPPSKRGIDDIVSTLAAILHNPDIAKRVEEINEGNANRKPDFTVIAPVGNKAGIELLKSMYGDKVGKWIAHDEAVANLIALAARQSGLSSVYEELFSFANGSEAYIFPSSDRRQIITKNYSPNLRKKKCSHPVTAVAGRTFREIQHGFEKSCPIGIRAIDGTIELNPRPDRIIENDAELIILAEDNEVCHMSFNTETADKHKNDVHFSVAPNQLDLIHTIVFGTGGSATKALHQLDKYCKAGSTFTVIVATEEQKRRFEAQAATVTNATMTTKIVPLIGLDDLREVLADDVNAVIVFPPDEPADSNSDNNPDTRTVRLLLQIRCALKGKKLTPRIVTEIIDERNLELADIAHAHDAIVSDRIISLYCLQLSENPHLAGVYEELLNPEGNEFSMHPIERYAVVGQEVDYHHLIAHTSQMRATFVGYQQIEHSRNRERKFGIVLNPPKVDKKGNTIKFTPQSGDKVIVIASN